MREYETVFIVEPNVPESQHKQLIDRYKAIIEKNEGKLFFARDMGKKTLGFPIKKQTKGAYTCLDYAAKGGAVSEIERAMRLEEDVLRFLTVVKAEDIDIEARVAEIAARREDVAPLPGEQALPEEDVITDIVDDQESTEELS